MPRHSAGASETFVLIRDLGRDLSGELFRDHIPFPPMIGMTSTSSSSGPCGFWSETNGQPRHRLTLKNPKAR